ncbi:hypothetical protein [Facklamia hominis]|uniref:hypothetical protein n=1 Tax=Facklamia hominis TaxID=178214 RepID=UPI0038FC2700
MIKLNSLILNGESSADFPFLVAVEEVPGIVRANKKDKIFKTDYASGAMKQSVDAYDTIDLQFVFYIHDVNRNQLRQFKSWFKDGGTLTRYDDPNMHYNYLSVEVESKPLDEVYGYEVTAIFLCEPFEYEEEQTLDITNLKSITNHTNAVMYPKITLTAESSQPMSLVVGQYHMYFHKGLRGEYELECKHGLQNLINKKNGELANDLVKGRFIEVVPGENTISKTEGFTSIKMLCRWGWR